MCILPKHKVTETATKEKKFRLADFFDNNWDSYIKNPKHFITPEQYKAVAAMRACRTEALGVDHYVCEECGKISKVYHSCKNRFCPTCSWKDTMKWAEKMEDMMLDIPHRHVVFTLPHKLNNLINDNKWGLLSSLLTAAAEAIKDWMMYKYKLTPGIISIRGNKKNAPTRPHDTFLGRGQQKLLHRRNQRRICQLQIYPDKI
jgi:hypothetical protein